MSDLIRRTEEFVKERLAGEESGHDWHHVDRVRRNALVIAEQEGADHEIVAIAALLHDIADRKFHGGDATIGSALVEGFLRTIGATHADIEKIIAIIESVSFSSDETTLSIEGKCVQDADRLDTLGAIGIARTFATGAKFGRPIYDPAIPPFAWKTKEEYKELLKKSTSFNHFTEKILKVKDLMRTRTGKRWAEERHDYLVQFMEQFLREWDSKDLR